MGTKAFKISGVIWAMSTLLCERLNIEISTVQSVPHLRSLYLSSSLPPLTFCTCTDGNHGAAVSLSSSLLGHSAVIYMPLGSSKSRVSRVTDHGASCKVTELTYDETVVYARDQSIENGWVLLQDTTLDDYTKVPRLVMEGYTLMASELISQTSLQPPTHVIVQAGVGSMAGSVVEFMSSFYTSNSLPLPIFVCLEPSVAACIFSSFKTGSLSSVPTTAYTMIAGLQCGVPSSIAWPILRDNVDFAVWIEDDIAGEGMREAKRRGYEAGECGGAGIGFVRRIMDGSEESERARERMGVGEGSRFLVFNTEGITDEVNYDLQMKIEGGAGGKFEIVDGNRRQTQL